MRTVACALLALLAGACTRSVADSGGSCELNSDCGALLVCAASLCRPQCRTGRDCATGETCHEVGGTGVCVPPAMPVPCAYSSQCGDGLSCVSGTCRAPCVTDRDCAPGTCVAGACSTPVVTGDAGASDGGPADAGPSGCVDGACPPANDECAGATPLVLVGGATAVTGAIGGATAGPSSCLGRPDVYFGFEVRVRSIVFVSSSSNTVTLFASCGGVPIGGCSGVGTCLGGDISSLLTVLDPGTYYLLLDADPSGTGYSAQLFTVPIVGAPRLTLSGGAQTLTGSTLPGSDTAASCGHGDDDVYVITTCANFAGGPLDADTCTGTTFDTALELDSGSGVAAQCGMGDSCGVQSRLSAWLPAGPGLYALRVGGATASDSGDYSLNVTLPM